MKSFRWTFVFIIAVALLVAFTVFDNKRTAEKEATTEKEQAVVKIPYDQIKRLEIVNRIGQLVLEKGDAGKWRVVVPVDDLADQQAIDSFLSSLESEKSTQTVVSGDEMNPETYGLSQPTMRLKVTGADGKVQEVKIGAVKAYNSNLYAQIDQEKRVLLVSSAWDSLLAKLPKDFRDKHVMRKEIKDAEIKRVEIRNANLKAPVAFKRDGEKWQPVRGVQNFPILSEQVNQFIDKVKGLRGMEFVDKSSTSAATKILAKPNLEISFYTDGKDPVFNAKFVNEPEGAKEAGGDHHGHHHGQGAANAWVSSSDLKDVLVVNKPVADTVRKTDQDFYDKKAPFRFTPNEAIKINIESKALRAHFEKKQDQWASADPGLQKDVDSAKLNELVEKLSKFEAVRVLDPIKKDLIGNPSRITLVKGDGSILFEMSWGNAMTDKIAGVEARYLAARTNLASHYVGVMEDDVSSLGLSALFKEKTSPPSASPSPPVKK